MTFRIEKLSDRGGTTIRLIGRMQAQHLAEVRKQIEASGPNITLDLKDVKLVDVDAVHFLSLCESDGIELQHCAPYIRAWMRSEQGQGA